MQPGRRRVLRAACAGRIRQVNVRQVIRLVSHDSHVMEWYETRDGKEAKIMEIAYSRAK